MDKKKKNKLILTYIFVIFLIGIVFTIVLLIMSFKNKGHSSSSSDESAYIEDAKKLKTSLIDFSNEWIDSEYGLNKKEEIYDCKDLISFRIDQSILYYSSFNDNYLYSLSVVINDMNDIVTSIENKNYSDVTINMKDIVKSEYNPLVIDPDYKTNIKGNNIKGIVNKTNDEYRYIDSTYLGNDDNIHSVYSFMYKNNDFNIEGLEENNLYSVNKNDKPVVYHLLNLIINN